MSDAAANAQAGTAAWRFATVILAAGASTRMGRPKQLLRVEGRPLLTRVAEAALAGGSKQVVVVLGAQAETVATALTGLAVTTVVNANWSAGMGTSLCAGLGAALDADPDLAAVLFTVCDQPAFSDRTVRALTSALVNSGRGIAAADYGDTWGVPALFLARHFPGLARLSADQGARALIVQQSDDVVPVALPELAVDLDTPADYERWSSAAGSRTG